MIVSTNGLSRADVLVALYKLAANHKKNKNLRTLFQLSNAQDYITRSEVQARMRKSPPQYNFTEIHCGGPYIEIKVCLINADQFDATEYDAMYGIGAAQRAINEFLNKRNNDALDIIEDQEELRQEQDTRRSGCMTPITPVFTRLFRRTSTSGSTSPVFTTESGRNTPTTSRSGSPNIASEPNTGVSTGSASARVVGRKIRMNSELSPNKLALT